MASWQTLVFMAAIDFAESSTQQVLALVMPGKNAMLLQVLKNMNFVQCEET